MTRQTATRRGVLGAVAALATGAAPVSAATSVPENATLIAPGPNDGAAAALATRAARGLARGLVQAAALRVAVVGGPDGITAANRFAASLPPEPPSLLLLPGLAGHSLLVGDPRARFEPRQWPALIACLQPAILAGRLPADQSLPVRLAMGGPGSPESAALLAIEMLGATANAVLLQPGMSAEAAVAAGNADAAVLTGPEPLAQAAALGLTPWFALDGADGARDPSLPSLPTLGELLPDPSSPDLLASIRAEGVALRLRGMLVLPALSGANAVALWRGAARRWLGSEPEAGDPGTRLLAPDVAAAALATLCPAPPVALAYREWLVRRLAWQAV